MNSSVSFRESSIGESHATGKSVQLATSVTTSETRARSIEAAATRRISNSESQAKADVNPATQVLGDVTATHENLQEDHVSLKQGKEERAPRNDNSCALVESSNRRSEEDSPGGKRKRQERKRSKSPNSRKNRGYQLETTDPSDSVSTIDFLIPLMGIFSEDGLEEFDRRNAGEIMTTTGCSLRLRSTTTDECFMKYKLTGTHGQVEWASNCLETYLINILDRSFAERALYLLGRHNHHRENVGDVVHQGCLQNRLIKKWMYCDNLPSDFDAFSNIVFGSCWTVCLKWRGRLDAISTSTTSAANPITSFLETQ